MVEVEYHDLTEEKLPDSPDELVRMYLIEVHKWLAERARLGDEIQSIDDRIYRLKRKKEPLTMQRRMVNKHIDVLKRRMRRVSVKESLDKPILLAVKKESYVSKELEEMR